MSERVRATDEPCIAKTNALMDGVEGVISMAQGVVFWPPPARAIQAATEACSTPSAHSYGPTQGMPALREALIQKLAEENDLKDVCVSTLLAGAKCECVTKNCIAVQGRALDPAGQAEITMTRGNTDVVVSMYLNAISHVECRSM